MEQWDYATFLVGGFLSLSGFRQDELRGQQMMAGRLGYLYRLPLPPVVLWKAVYMGVWGELGNIWERFEDIKISQMKRAGTLAVGFQTKIGSVFLGYGLSSTDSQQFYISVGRSFGLRSPSIR